MLKRVAEEGEQIASAEEVLAFLWGYFGTDDNSVVFLKAAKKWLADNVPPYQDEHDTPGVEVGVARYLQEYEERGVLPVYLRWLYDSLSHT